MPGFTSIVGQKLPLRILQTLLAKGTVPHALLFTGPAGVGKRTAARYFAMAMNCQAPDPSGEKPCLECRACRQIQSGQHPDIIVIEPKGAVLRINQVRELLGVLAMKPFQAEHRVVILARAEAMNPEAGNALLKALEEPPADTVMVLTAEKQSDLLPTIVSRCRHIRFNPLSARQVTSLLAEQRDLQGQQAESVAQMCAGSFAKALQLFDMGWRDQRTWLIRASGLDRPGPSGRRSIGAALSFAAQLAERKETVQHQLDMLKTWIRDLAVVDHMPDQVVNRDCLEQLKQVSRGFQAETLISLWQTMENTQKAIAGNANLRLTLDTMALAMLACTAEPALTLGING
ncbi:MAG: DNA polymerase III subunit delta' [Desulfosarcinaceae bacterium]